MKAVICPVCGGNGIVDEGFYRQTSGQWTSVGGTETCRGCRGKGWVSVEGSGEIPFEEAKEKQILFTCEDCIHFKEADIVSGTLGNCAIVGAGPNTNKRNEACSFFSKH